MSKDTDTNVEITKDDELLLTGYGFDYSSKMKPNLNFDKTEGKE